MARPALVSIEVEPRKVTDDLNRLDAFCHDSLQEVDDATRIRRVLVWVYGTWTWSTKNLLRSPIFDYIEGSCSPERIEERLGYRSQADFESAAVA